MPVKPADFDRVPNEAKDPDGYYVAQRLNVMAFYLRDDKVAAADRPKAWTDLTGAKYAGKMVMADPSFSSLLVAVVRMLAKDDAAGAYAKEALPTLQKHLETAQSLNGQATSARR